MGKVLSYTLQVNLWYYGWSDHLTSSAVFTIPYGLGFRVFLTSTAFWRPRLCSWMPAALITAFWPRPCSRTWPLAEPTMQEKAFYVVTSEPLRYEHRHENLSKRARSDGHFSMLKIFVAVLVQTLSGFQKIWCFMTWTPKMIAIAVIDLPLYSWLLFTKNTCVMKSLYSS